MCYTASPIRARFLSSEAHVPQVHELRWSWGGGPGPGGDRDGAVGPEGDSGLRHKASVSANRTDSTCDLRRHTPKALCCVSFNHNVVFILKFQVSLKGGQEIFVFLKRETEWHVTLSSFLVTPCRLQGNLSWDVTYDCLKISWLFHPNKKEIVIACFIKVLCKLTSGAKVHIIPISNVYSQLLILKNTFAKLAINISM